MGFFPPGTFAVVCLMVGNSIIKVLEALDLEICLENDGVELFVNGSGRYSCVCCALVTVVSFMLMR